MVSIFYYCSVWISSRWYVGMGKVSEYDRKIHQDIHDISHALAEAGKWLTVARKFMPPILMKQADRWFKEVDMRVQNAMLRENKAIRKENGGPNEKRN